MSDEDTIAAIATAPGRGGIGVIRISGPAAPVIADKMWRGAIFAAHFESHQLYYGDIVDCRGAVPAPDAEDDCGRARGPAPTKILDRALIVWMKAPHSYTGEDVVEIQAHGGPRLLEQILQLVLKNGARLARPGEFTERAFLNGRIDLTEAEAIADLIASESDAGLDMAREQLSGRLRDAVTRIRQDLIVMRSQVEAMIDFPEDEDVNVLHYDEVGERCGRLIAEISKWLNSYEEGRLRRDGIRVVLAGRPNVGKSSLLNALLGEDRVIVHNEAGTTRDVVEEAIQLNGVLIRLSDTAGLHEGQGTVESEGIRRSLQRVADCDLVCFVIDGTEPLANSDRSAYGQIKAKPHLIIENKCDMPLFNPDHILDEAFPEAKRLTTSAETGVGIDALKATIFETALPHGRASADLYIANQRHKICLEKTLETLGIVQKSAKEKAGLELLAADLLIAANRLGEITGEITHDEILSEIFSRFCLGK